jgi:hypothetical protein
MRNAWRARLAKRAQVALLAPCHSAVGGPLISIAPDAWGQVVTAALRQGAASAGGKDRGHRAMCRVFRNSCHGRHERCGPRCPLLTRAARTPFVRRRPSVLDSCSCRVAVRTAARTACHAGTARAPLWGGLHTWAHRVDPQRSADSRTQHSTCFTSTWAPVRRECRKLLCRLSKRARA